MASRLALASVVAAAASLAACRAPVWVNSPAPSSSALVTLRDASGRQVGTITMADTYAGVLINGQVTGVGLGTHGIHIHETGTCVAPFATAGGHFNPHNRRHGFKNPEGRHAGDLPNIDTPAAGPYKFEMLMPDISLRGENALVDADGAAVVIHASADDYATDPAGGSGGRIACGVIVVR